MGTDRIFIVLQCIIGNDACVPMSKQKHRDENRFRLLHADAQSALHRRENRKKFLGIDQFKQGLSTEIIRLKKETEIPRAAPLGGFFMVIRYSE